MLGIPSRVDNHLRTIEIFKNYFSSSIGSVIILLVFQTALGEGSSEKIVQIKNIECLMSQVQLKFEEVARNFDTRDQIKNHLASTSRARSYTWNQDWGQPPNKARKLVK